jgi:hypothetical protein
LAIKPNPIWPERLNEEEYNFLSQIPRGTIVQAIPANRVSPLWVNARGELETYTGQTE